MSEPVISKDNIHLPAACGGNTTGFVVQPVGGGTFITMPNVRKGMARAKRHLDLARFSLLALATLLVAVFLLMPPSYVPYASHLNF